MLKSSLLAEGRHNCAKSFSALQRAEIAEIEDQLRKSPRYSIVSVLFNEPKLLKWIRRIVGSNMNHAFQCSSASRKFLNRESNEPARFAFGVSVLFSEPKIPQFFAVQHKIGSRVRFSALQRAENSSMFLIWCFWNGSLSFSALQRAENSSIPTLAPASIHISDRDDHASSFLSLPGASP